jgi:hypothetical protein
MKYQQRIAKIKSTALGFDDHGLLMAWLGCDFGVFSQSIGSGVMSTVDEGPGNARAIAIPTVGDFVIGVLRACGVKTWEQLIGHTIYALYAPDAGWNDQPVGIENLPTEAGERFMLNEWRKTAVTNK